MDRINPWPFTALIDGVSRTHAVRDVTLDGKPWFVAADCIRVLGLDVSSTSKHLAKLDDDEQRVLKRTRRGEAPSEDYRNRLLGELGHRIPMLSLISESGLYRLFNRSDKPQAKPFQDWVTREVLLSIRKHGDYARPKDEAVPLPVAYPQVHHVGMPRGGPPTDFAVDAPDRICTFLPGPPHGAP